MTIPQSHQHKPGRQQFCWWCGNELEPHTRGRKRRYCSRSCRQRAYEQRKRISGAGVEVEGSVISDVQMERLTDRLFEVRCAAEDISTAIAEGEKPAELSKLALELVQLARRAEQFRG